MHGKPDLGSTTDPQSLTSGSDLGMVADSSDDEVMETGMSGARTVLGWVHLVRMDRCEK